MSAFVKQSVENFLASPIFQHALLIPAYAPGTFFQSLTPHPTGEQQLGTVDNTLPPPVCSTLGVFSGKHSIFPKTGFGRNNIRHGCVSSPDNQWGTDLRLGAKFYPLLLLI